MKTLHPVINVLKDEISRQDLTYKELSEKSSINLNIIKNIFSGRRSLNVIHRDAICRVLGIDPGTVVLRRPDLVDTSRYLDLHRLRPDLQVLIRKLFNELERPETKPLRRRRAVRAASLSPDSPPESPETS